MKQCKRFLALLLSAAMLFATLSTEAFAATNAPDNAVLTVESITAVQGEEITLNVSVQNNPGILGGEIQLSYDSALTLKGVTAGEAFSYMNMTKPGKLVSGCRFLWDGMQVLPQDAVDGVILSLTFDVSPDAEPGSYLEVSVTPDGFYDGDVYSVEVSAVKGGVAIADYTPGDVNDDARVNAGDVILVRRFITGGYNVSINENAANVNLDDRINSADVILIRRFIAGGYTFADGTPVELYPASKNCVHDMAATAYKAATCTEDGNTAYWFCSKCQKYFSDSYGNHTISLANTVLKATGHTIVLDKRVDPTYTSEGLTEGSHCSACKEVLVKQEIIPVLKGNDIVYNLVGSDTYLASVKIENPNPSVYQPGQSLRLLEPEVKGYTFEGWYDGAGSSAKKMTNIPADAAGTVYLYAKWTPIVYTITFDSPLVSVPDKTYTVDKGATLTEPSLDRYNFIAWTQDVPAVDPFTRATYTKTEIVNNIPKGTYGNITLKANFSSKRNQTIPYALTDPIVVEDVDNGVILFAYELGRMENIPLYKIMDLTSAGGIITTQEVTKTVSVTQGTAQQIAETIANATTNSASWTLSSDWNSNTSVSQSTMDTRGWTEQQAETYSQSSTGTYSLTSSAQESKSVVDSNGVSGKITSSKSSSETESTSKTKGSELHCDAKVSAETTFNILGKKVKAKAEVSGGGSKSKSTTDSESKTETSSSSMELGATSSHSVTGSKSINTSAGYSASNSVSANQTLSKTLSGTISSTSGYGQSYSEGGSQSENAGYQTSESKSDQYSNTITWNQSEVVTTTTKYQTNGLNDGYYRLVLAGTAHVYGVVGYDVASASYFTYTYSVMDDDTYQYIDYSRTTPNFDDNENGILPFEIPYFVDEYVSARITGTEGLVYDIDTGIVDEYVGEDTYVVVPTYFRADNGDGTYKSVAVKGVSSEAFRNNESLKYVGFGSQVSSIPANTFSGCTSLREINISRAASIGENAFSGCVNLADFVVSDAVKTLGNNAFAGVNKIEVKTTGETENGYSDAVAQAAVNSGAKNIVLNIAALSGKVDDMTFAVPAGTDKFELQGERNSFKNLKLSSEAQETVLNGLTITECRRIPLEITAEKITMNQVNVTAPGFVLLLKGNSAAISLYGTSTLTSESGKVAVMRNPTLKSLSSSVVGKLNVSGDVMVNLTSGAAVDSISGVTRLNVNNGTLKAISDEEYVQFIKGAVNVNFDGNDGNTAVDSMLAYIGSQIGTLPEATREHFEFLGWFTEAEGGNQVMADTAFTDMNDVTLYAHWDADAYTVNWSDGIGYVITVTRTASPYKGAFTGGLNRGDVIYYGDELNVNYTTTEGYTLESNGAASITVAGMVDNSMIYASAAANLVTYNWYCKSVNGTVLSTGTRSGYYGTKDGFVNPSIAGYNALEGTTAVEYDSLHKDIIILYSPNGVTNPLNVASGTMWQNGSVNALTYSVTAEYRNRTANTVEVKLNWTQTIAKNYYYGYAQYFTPTIGGTTLSQITLCSSSTWSSSSTSARSVTKSTDWVTVAIGATSSNVAVSASWKAQAGLTGSWNGTMYVPCY